jgi:hypothetical protein
MIETDRLRRAMAIGTAAQITFCLVAHATDWVALHALDFGAMLISAIAGYIHAQTMPSGFAAGALSGALAGAVCGTFGAAFSIVLGDADPGRFAIDIVLFAAAGAAGAAFGRIAAR